MKLFKMQFIIMVFAILLTGCPAEDDKADPYIPPPSPPGLSDLVDGGGKGVPYTVESFPLEGEAQGGWFHGFESDINVKVIMENGFITGVVIGGGNGESVDVGKCLIYIAANYIVEANSVEDGVIEANEKIIADGISSATATATGIIKSGEDAIIKIAQAFKIP